MKRYKSAFFAAILATLPAAALQAADIIPLPVSVTDSAGQFELGDSLRIVAGDAALKPTAQVLADLLNRPMGKTLAVDVATDAPAGAIVLTNAGADAALGDEGYTLSVKPTGVVIRATSSAGLFYGVQTLRQLLPAEAESKTKVDSAHWTLPCVEITDSPRFKWRGLMLDCARHFFTKDEVKQFLDVMAMHKLNTFHWHLVDDQGWRVEIKKYPKLTEIGAWRDVPGFTLDPERSKQYIRASDGKYGGFYTQDDIREVVAYAAERHITIVPEIEMPGHSTAALAAYPELGTTHQPMTIPAKGGVMHGIYDPTSETVYQFVDDVLSEIAPLFPGEFIHVGGDEVPKDLWKKSEACQAFMKANGLKDEEELQGYFMKRAEKIVASKGKRMIGWDEILEGGLAPGAAVMSWRGLQGGVAAARAGHDVVMTPNSYLYLDYGQTRAKGQPKVIGGFVPLSRVYSFDPAVPQLSADEQKHILGAQGNLWAEYFPNFQQVQLMAYPRALAVAEMTWTPQARREFSDFKRRVVTDEKRFDVMGVNYFHDTGYDDTIAGQWKPSQMSTSPKTLTWDVTKFVPKPGIYRITFQYTGGHNRLDINWAAVGGGEGKELSRDTHAGTTGSRDNNNVYTLDLTGYTPGTPLTLSAEVSSDGGTDSSGTIMIVPK